jgi:hypothetical protein
VRLAAAKRAHLVWEFVPQASQEFKSTKLYVIYGFALHSFDHAPKNASHAHEQGMHSGGGGSESVFISRREGIIPLRWK